MSNDIRRRRSIFGGLLLVILGVLLLWHKFRGGFDILDLLGHWWPALLILWGLAKLYDHLAARRTGEVGPPTITGGDTFLIILVLVLAGAVGGYDWIRQHGGKIDFPSRMPWERTYDFSEEVPAKPVPADARITIRTDYGDISVHPEETAEIRVLVKKSVPGSSESDAQERAKHYAVEVAASGGGYDVRTQGTGKLGERIQMDLEVHVPKRASVTARTERGDLQVTGIAGSVTAESQRGNIEVRDTGGDVSVEARHGDTHIVGAAGNVKLSGRGGEVEIADVKGEAVIEGEFYGPIRVEKAAKGARFVSRRTDLTVSQLAGRLETSSGKMEITDAPGNVSLVTRKYDVTLENVGGRVHIENRDGNVELRFAQPPREPLDVSTTSGSIELVLPPKSAFEVRAEARSGEIESEFEELAKQQVEKKGNTTLEGKVGTKGPPFRLQTSYGTIRLRKGR
ncbi:MAG: DUF4097 family beta strand repeat protein [Acidobacteria bacterium]|nr:DUF4097 family beta strand repeat protein [Acidobacteriota bacterium]